MDWIYVMEDTIVANTKFFRRNQWTYIRESNTTTAEFVTLITSENLQLITSTSGNLVCHGMTFANQ